MNTTTQDFEAARQEKWHNFMQAIPTASINKLTEIVEGFSKPESMANLKEGQVKSFGKAIEKHLYEDYFLGFCEGAIKQNKLTDQNYVIEILDNIKILDEKELGYKFDFFRTAVNHGVLRDEHKIAEVIMREMSLTIQETDQNSSADFFQDMIDKKIITDPILIKRIADCILVGRNEIYEPADKKLGSALDEWLELPHPEA